MEKEKLFSVTKKDLEMQTFRCGGHGGQKVNKTSSGVRLIHHESGAIGESREERSQSQNKKNALKRLASSQKFKLWMQKKAFELSCDKKKIKNQVDIAVREENLKVEIRENGKWIKLSQRARGRPLSVLRATWAEDS